MANNKDMKIARVRADMTLMRLAVLTQINIAKLSHLERNILRPRPDEAERIAKALGVQVEEIFKPNGGGGGR